MRSKSLSLALRTALGLGVGLLGCSEAAEQAAPPPAGEAPLAQTAEPVESGGGSAPVYTEQREPCASRNPLGNAYWGELHVHTELSMDAYLWDVRGTPDDAFDFAKGKPSFFAPLDADGRESRPTQLERPLDFVALTDHASFLGEVSLCISPGSAAYDSDTCKVYRGEIEPPGEHPMGSFAARLGILSNSLLADSAVPARKPALCGDDLHLCIDAMTAAWEELQAAAERHYDRSSDCSFTTFHAYEYTATPKLAKVHHNVIFRNEQVPRTPIAWVDEPDVYGLFEKLREQCLEQGNGCDVITIPHNSNLSNGNMFRVEDLDLPIEERRERARLRADIERLVEITQIKGDSECRNGMNQVLGRADEFCDYEEWRPPGTEDCKGGFGFGALGGRGCVDRTDYVRYALIDGMRLAEELGVNPYELGIIAATDAHNANPGDVEEYSYDGWRGSADATPQTRLSGGVTPAIANVASNPGGIAGVWAYENSRDALFDAMKRRETFGTSGPRMTARFFGGWSYPEDLCNDPDLLEQAYRGGVPMGGRLATPPPEDAGGPRFVVTAMRDPGIDGHPGGSLQRAQIVKGWVDGDGMFRQQVTDVAGGANDASVDLGSCEPRGPGHDSLCAVWQDSSFDPDQAAFYYLRVLENPSCRWSQLQCNALPEGERPAACSGSVVPAIIQERLWTSPIWYQTG